MTLIPVLFITLILTSIHVEWGILFFAFAFPLINILPYFFGIYRDIPHAPTALVLFLIFFLGWLLNKSLFYSKSALNYSVFKPILLLALIISVSGVITFFRYANFFPFMSDNIHELIVNVNRVRTGGAMMSIVFNSLSYLTGFCLFFILINTIKTKDFTKKLLIVLATATLISLFFSLIQKYHSISLGNTPFWVKIDRINATFKDPNSFGVFLSAFFPVLLGMTFSFQKLQKLLSLFLVILALFIFPVIGSRSGFLGLIISSMIFFLLFLISYKFNLKKKFIFLTSFFLINVVILLFFFILSKQSNLFIRLNQSLNTLSNKNPLNTLFLGKLNLWAAASDMIKDYPLTGVGLGAYIVELPNYAKQMGLPFKHTDSAENYFFQWGAEFGLIGLFLVFWLFFEIGKQMKRNWREFSNNNKDKFIFIGIISGIISILVNFVFHSYIGSYEVKYFFWLLVALTFTWPQTKERPDVSTKSRRNVKIMAVILAVIFGASHLWNSSRSLSVKNETEKYGWEQNFGLYRSEKDKRGFSFRWTKKTSGIAVENIGDTLVLPMIASHPDILRYPVKVKVFSSNPYFQKKKVIKEITFNTKEWIDFEYSIPDKSGKKIHLVFETNRIWQPLKYLGLPDPRLLAIGLGEEWFRYPSEISQEKIKAIQTISSNNWEGDYKRNLITYGTSRIKFKTHKKNIFIRLWVKGQKALNVGPYIIIRLDDHIVGKTQLTEEKWISLVFTPEISTGGHVLSVEFTNDFYNRELGQDRNVLLGDLEIISLQ